MVELIGPHGSVTRVSGVEAIRLRRGGWVPVEAPKRVEPDPEDPLLEGADGSGFDVDTDE